MNDHGRIDRRRFTRQLAVGAGSLTAVFSGTSAAIAETPPAPSLPENPPVAPLEKPAPSGTVPPEPPPPEVMLLTYLVRAHPSDHFDDAAVQGIFRDIRGDLARGQLLAEFPLKNSDEPAFAFRASPVNVG
jgi:hypothetical protein